MGGFHSYDRSFKKGQDSTVTKAVFENIAFAGPFPVQTNKESAASYMLENMFGEDVKPAQNLCGENRFDACYLELGRLIGSKPDGTKKHAYTEDEIRGLYLAMIYLRSNALIHPTKLEEGKLRVNNKELGWHLRGLSDDEYYSSIGWQLANNVDHLGQTRAQSPELKEFLRKYYGHDVPEVNNKVQDDVVFDYLFPFYRSGEAFKIRQGGVAPVRFDRVANALMREKIKTLTSREQYEKMSDEDVVGYFRQRALYEHPAEYIKALRVPRFLAAEYLACAVSNAYESGQIYWRAKKSQDIDLAELSEREYSKAEAYVGAAQKIMDREKYGSLGLHFDEELKSAVLRFKTKGMLALSSGVNDGSNTLPNDVVCRTELK